jgi:hypothetical protein
MFSLFVLYIWQRNSQYQSSAAPSLRSLFLARVFLCGLQHSGPSISTSVLIDSAYKHQFQYMDELYVSGVRLAYPRWYNFIFENGDETEASKAQRHRLINPSFEVCLKCARYQEDVGISVADMFAEGIYALG